jgi:hypothetical protein
MFSEMLVNTDYTTWSHNPEDHKLDTHLYLFAYTFHKCLNIIAFFLSSVL